MLSVSPVVKIFLYGQAADLRRGYDGLASIVQEAMEEDPLSGSLFVFVNKRANRIKLLYWDETGYAIWMKRLEVGTFELPRAGESESARVKITPSQLSLILDGIELSSVRRRKRYRLESACHSS
jgi:transposase